MDFATIIYEKLDRIARLTLNRPQYRNAQSRTMLEEMDLAFADAEADDEIRVIILAGAGEHFCSGHDLGTSEEKADSKKRRFPRGVRGEYARSRRLFLDNTLRWRDIDKPTIAQVQGYCIFGGWMFAAAMDLIVASDDAMFLPALLQYFSIPYDIGPRKAKEVLFQSRFMTAQEASDLGFVNLVVPREKLAEETDALAKRIAETDRMTLRMTKRAVNLAQDAMGFTTAVRNAHSHHLMASMDRYIQAITEGKELPKRMPGVDQALRKPRG